MASNALDGSVEFDRRSLLPAGGGDHTLSSKRPQGRPQRWPSNIVNEDRNPLALRPSLDGADKRPLGPQVGRQGASVSRVEWTRQVGKRCPVYGLDAGSSNDLESVRHSAEHGDLASSRAGQEQL